MEAEHEVEDRIYKRAQKNLRAEMIDFIRFLAQMQTQRVLIKAHAKGIVRALDEQGADENDYVTIRSLSEL